MQCKLLTLILPLLESGGAGLRAGIAAIAAVAAVAAVEANPQLKIALISKVYPMRSHTVAPEGGSAAATQDHDTIEIRITIPLITTSMIPSLATIGCVSRM